MKTKLIYFDDSFDCSGIVACIGEFDGIHVGHGALVDAAVEEAKKHGFKSAMISFYPHPDYVFKKRPYEGYLTTEDDKLDVLSVKGVDYLIIMDFEQLCSVEYDVFYDKYLSNFEGIVAGFDFKFGYKGLGNVEFLKEKFNICRIIDKVEINNAKVSSRDIRSLLNNGEIQSVTELLGRFYSLYAIVGDKEGDFIVCDIDSRCFKPMNGVYKCEYLINECETCPNICIIEGTALKMSCDNLSKGQVVKVSLKERIESGV